MDYEKFKEKFTEDLKSNLETRGYDIASIEITPSQKLNQDAYDAISVKLEDSMMGPSGNFSNLFAAFEKAGDYDMILDHATQLMDEAISHMPTYDMSQITDYDFIKDKLVLEAVNSEKNAALLEKVPHKDMEDIAIVYRVLLGQMDDGVASVVVSNEMLEKMNVTKEQLHKDALISSPEIRPVEVNTLFGTIAELLPDVDLGIPAGGPEDQILVGTVTDKHHGAGVIAYEGFLDEQARKMGEDFYIIPCSIHEVLLVPESMGGDIEALKEMIASVNTCELSPEDVLSNNLYHYDSKEKIFEIADTFKERIAAKEREPDKEKESAVGKLKKTQDKVKEAPKKEHKSKIKDKPEMAL